MCGHHACYHELGSDRLDDVSSVAIASPLPAQHPLRPGDDKGLMGERLQTSPTNANGQPVYLQLISSRSDGRLETMAGMQLVSAQRLNSGNDSNMSKGTPTAPPVFDTGIDGDILPDTNALCINQPSKAQVRPVPS